MNFCSLRDPAQEQRLDTEQKQLFDTHLAACDACREAMAQWQETKRHLNTYLDERSPDPSTAARERLLATAAAGSSVRPLSWMLPATAAVAAAVIVIALNVPHAVEVENIPATKLEDATFSYQVVYPATRQGPVSVRRNERIKGTASGRVVRFQHSVLGLNDTSKIAVAASDITENRFVLESGIVAVELPLVNPRETLSIRAGTLTVSVKGTIFWVELLDDDIAEIGVVRGVVSVAADGGQNWEVKAGNKLVVFGDRHSETLTASDIAKKRALSLLDPVLVGEGAIELKVTPEIGRSAGAVSKVGQPELNEPDISTIEKWILEKKYVEAQRALERRLKANAKDRYAVELSAACYRKQGRYEKAAEIYDRLTTIGSPEDRNRARYKLSAIYQEDIGNHVAAVNTLRAYLSSPPAARSNTIEAELRLADSLKHLGRDAEYRRVLETIVSAHPGTQAAQKANQLLTETP